MNNEFYNEKQQQERRSQSQKLSHSRKIKKYYDKTQKNKQKSNTPKITQFFKKLNKIQKPLASSQKIENNRRNFQQQIQIEALKQQQRQLIHQEQQLKRQIETLKSQQNIIKQQNRTYLKNVRNVKLNDIKNRYQMMRLQRQLPQFMNSSYFIEQINLLNNQNKKQSKISFQLKQINEKIERKKQFLDQKKSQINFIQKIHLEEQIKTLINEKIFLINLNEQTNQKIILAQKQKKSKFYLLKWPLLNKKYQTLQLLGSGGYSQVYKALNIVKNQYVAIKLCSVSQMAQVSEAVYLRHLFRQFETHKQLNHQNIVKVYEVIQLDQNTFCLVLQYCQGPQLSKYLRQKKYLSQKQTKSIMFQIFEALYYLNSCSRKIIHYDLKPQNIMFNQGLIKILDFGLTKHLDDQKSRAALTSVGMGTYVYLPPECNNINNQDDNELVLTSKIDVWSAGIIFFELLTGQRPNNHMQSALEFIYKNRNIIISNQTINIIKMCLKINPQQRISPQQIYFHQYFHEFNRKFKK